MARTGWLIISAALLCSVFVGVLALNEAAPQYPNVRVQFVNAHVGWIVGPRLLQTTDGGRTWKRVRSDGYGTFEAESVGFGHRLIQFVNADAGVQLDLNGIVKTGDGGRTWSKQFPLPKRDAPEIPAGSLFFLTPDVGWVVNEMVYRTIDGGQTWTQLAMTPRGSEVRQRAMRVAPTLADFIPALWFTDDQNGFMARLDGEVYKTTDAGKTWTRILAADSKLTSIFFVNGQSGWVTGARGFIARTVDGGVTWSTPPATTTADLTGIFFINKETGWAVGAQSTILYTDDGGLTWKQGSVSGLLGAPPLASVSFVDEQRGWAVGGNGEGDPFSPVSPSNVILATQDGGQTWKSVTP